MLAESLQLLHRAEELARATGESAILVGLSGGKDSVVTLDLAVRVFKRVECFFMYLVRGLQCVEAPLDVIAKHYGVRVHKLPHFNLARMLRYAIFSPHRNGPAHNIRLVKYTDVEAKARELSGTLWVARGERATDSLERNAMLRKLGGINEKAARVYPIWPWKTRDVYAYLRTRRLPFVRQLVHGNVSGVGLQAKTLIAIRDRYPDDYRKILEVFPYAEAGIIRAELRKQWAAEHEQVPEVRDRTVE